MTEQPHDPTGLRYYGSDMTIHQTTGLDVEVDKDGKVVAVWFRCQPLPFKQSDADDRRAEEMRQMYSRDQHGFQTDIEAVVLRESK